MLFYHNYFLFCQIETVLKTSQEILRENNSKFWQLPKPVRQITHAFGIVHERGIKFLLNDRNKSRNLQSFGDFWTKSCQFLINNEILWPIWSFFTGLLSFNWILWWQTNVIRKLIILLDSKFPEFSFYQNKYLVC